MKRSKCKIKYKNKTTQTFTKTAFFAVYRQKLQKKKSLEFDAKLCLYLLCFISVDYYFRLSAFYQKETVKFKEVLVFRTSYMLTVY